MAYVKKFDHGTISMDLPYFSYIYQLPLFSFGDTLGSLGVSLVFNYRLLGDDNAYNIKPGYKLNLQKRLMISDTGAYSFQDENGKTIGLESYDDISLRFLTDESQRFVYQQGDNYVLEYPDFSKEIFSSDGKILSSVDKYGNNVLTYAYDSENKLTSVTYRGEKTVRIGYDNANRITTLSFYGKNISFTGQDEIYVRFCTGEVVLLERNDFNFSAKTGEIEANESFACKKEIKVIGDEYLHIATITNAIHTDNHTINTINTIEYAFPYNTDFGYYSNQVEIKDARGAKQRVQFIKNSPSCAYEISGNDVEFIEWNQHAYTPGVSPSTYRFAGNVQLLGKDNSNGATQTIGQQMFRDGDSMLPVTNSPGRWESRIADDYKNFTLSGWVKIIGDIHDSDVLTICVSDDDSDGTNNKDSFVIEGISCNKWRYFSAYISLPRETNEVHVYGTVEYHEFKMIDFRITNNEKDVKGKEGDSHILTPVDGLVSYDGETLEFVPMDECDFWVNDRDIHPVSSYDKVYYEDVLKNKINYKKRIHRDSFICGKISNAACRDINREVTVINGDRELPFSRYYPAKRQYVKEFGYVTTYAIDDEDSAFLIVRTVGPNGQLLTSQSFDEDLDIVSHNNGETTVSYTKDALGRYTGETTKLFDTNIDFYSHSKRYGKSDNNETVILANDFGVSSNHTLDEETGSIIFTKLPDGTIVNDEYDDSNSSVIKRIFGTPDGRNISFGYLSAFSTSLQSGEISYGFNYQTVAPTNASTELKTVRSTVTNQGSPFAVYETAPTLEKAYYPSAESPTYTVITNFDKYGRVVSVDGVISNEYNILATFITDSTTTVVNGNNKDSLLSKTTDVLVGETTTYGYDGNDLLINMKVVKNENSEQVSNQTFSYDKIGRLTDYVNIIGSAGATQTINVGITYLKSENDINADTSINKYSYKVDGSEKALTTNAYDVLKRISSKTTVIENASFVKDFGFNKTRISCIQHKFLNNPIGNEEFTYDQLGRITDKAYIFNSTHKDTYVYDVYGQLIRENNKTISKTYTYNYNNNGDIVSVSQYSYNEGDLSGSPSTITSYVYDDTYKDRLISYDGNTISYNASGYISSYEGKDYTWQRSKLSSITKGHPILIVDNYEHCGFEYNALGQRVSKTYVYKQKNALMPEMNPTYNTSYTYDYFGRLISETCFETYEDSSFDSTQRLVYLYDESGIVGIMYGYNTTKLKLYYYQRNALGDVIAIRDTNGNKVAEYAYDAYGNCTTVRAPNIHLATYNPIRYRGYYYDRETDYYYIDGRYYNTEWRRFIQPADPSTFSTSNVNGLNLYCYANNNPMGSAGSGYDFGVSSIGGMVNSSSLATNDNGVCYNDSSKSHRNVLPIPDWIKTASSMADLIVSFINPVRTAIYTFKTTDLWDLMRLDGVDELPGGLSKSMKIAGYSLAIVNAAMVGYEKYSSGASIVSAFAGARINASIGIGSIYVSTLIGGHVVSLLSATTLSGGWIVLLGAGAAFLTSTAINHFLTKLEIDGKTIEGHWNDLVDWLIWWD